MNDDLEQIVEAVARLPPAQWEAELRRLIPNADDAEQALWWLQARRAFSAGERPRLEGEAAQRYELVRRIDEGATGSVWHARDHRFNEDVAIKIFNEDRDNQRVLSEARAMRGIANPHVVPIYEVHVGQPSYIVMAFVAERVGRDDDKVIGRSAVICPPESLAETVEWMIQAARGIHLAHGGDVFHRDLKPENLLVKPRTRAVLVTDFGIAANAASVRGDRTLTLVRGSDTDRLQTEGTPAYMAPEQARGLDPDLDPTTLDDRAQLIAIDVWGLGALAFALITGRAPWQADSGLAAWELAAEATATPIAERTRDGRPVPRRLRRIVAKAMAMEPGQRFPTAAALAEAFEDYRDKRPTSLDRSLIVRGWLRARRNRPLVAATLTVIACAALVGLTMDGYRRIQDEHAALTAKNLQIGTELDRKQLELRMAETARQTALDDRDKFERELALAQSSAARARDDANGLAKVLDAELLWQRDATRRAAIEKARAQLELLATQLGRTLLESAYTRAAQDSQSWQDRYEAEQRLREDLEQKVKDLTSLVERTENARRLAVEATTVAEAKRAEDARLLKAALDELAELRPIDAAETAVPVDAGTD